MVNKKSNDSNIPADNARIGTISLQSTITLLSLVFMLSACSHLPDWFGDKKTEIKGTRISVLGVENTINPDGALGSLKVLIPHAMPSDKWYKSNGRNYFVPSNPELSKNFSDTTEVIVGYGGNSGQHISATPIIADNKIFTISSDSVVSAFDAHNLKAPLWRTKLRIGDTKERFSSAAGILYDAGKIYATTGYSEVKSLDASTGAVLWTKELNSVARSAPDVKGNNIFINTLDNKLYALDKNDGSILWVHSGSTEEISVFGSASPVVYDDVVLAPYSSGEIFALKTNDGSEIWGDTMARQSFTSSAALSDIDASPVVSFGKVFVISADGILAALDLRGNKRLWEQRVSGNQSPWIAGDFLYLISDKNQLMCLHVPSGGIKWIKQLPSYKKEKSKDGPIVWSGPVLAGDQLWAVGSNGKLLSMSPRNGNVETEYKVMDDIYLPPVVAYGNMYLYNDYGWLIMLRGDGSAHSAAIKNQGKQIPIKPKKNQEQKESPEQSKKPSKSLPTNEALPSPREVW